MTLGGLIRLLAQDPGFAAAQALVRRWAEADDAPSRVDVRSPAGIRPALAAALANELGTGQLVLVTASTSAAEEFATAARAFLPRDAIAVLPAWETLPHERLSPRADTLGRRTAIFHRLAHPDQSGPHGPVRLLVTPIRSLLQPVVAGLGELAPVRLAPGDRADLADLTQRLADYAYTRVDMVTRRGEFAVRGGIVDVFAPTDDHPVRVDFWGDEVEEVRYFSVTDQRSGDVVEHGLLAPPCRELLLTASVRERAGRLAGRLPGVADMLVKVSEGIATEGMESLTPLLADGLVPLTALLGPGSVLAFVEPERLRRRAADLLATADEFLHAAWEAAAAGGEAPVQLSEGSFLTEEQLWQAAGEAGCAWWHLTPFGLPDAAGSPDDAGSPELASETGVVERLAIGAGEVENFRGKVQTALKQLKQWVKGGWQVVLTTEGRGPAKRLAERLADQGVPARLVDGLGAAVEPGVVHVTTASGEGFVLPELHLAVVTERDLTGRQGTSTRDMRRMPARSKRSVDPLALKAGDLVVHEQHGVGRFVELVERTVGTGANQATREFLVMEYAPSRRGHPADRLYVPTDSLDQVTKYVGGENPPLSKLGGTDWAKTKAKARGAVRQLAGELIRLYAARMATSGYAFSPDTPWQRELEDAFAYVETADQLVTIDEVKADMQRPVPMDRLICGDVGYGKTEIAVRAAFKAVQDGKQVAVLVPTTLLVQQHMETFSERYAPFPVTVKPLSRFQSRAEAAKTKDGLASGAVDVVIGTHALVTGDVRFKDLGLVIVDEEQRFGVEHKETLKAQRPDVDVLSMSATPIPRTLEMAVSGIREMSTLATPPEERHPVLTYVGPATPGQTAAAIRRELLREGQVFYVHNRVGSISRVAAQVQELVPEARIAIAHGQMNEHQLEQVIIDFWEKRFDVLVCTTIIETGLDIANANTLIVDGADKFGLAQLHQLRGRVGRGRERAYAYFLYNPDQPLTETAHDRLSTIAAQSDLGAGMQVALKDLELRGAGNLLGGEQSGHIAGVGFDLYLRMIAEAVAESRGETKATPDEVTIELPIDAHIPVSYIEHDRLRLEAYAKLAGAATQADLDLVADELADRYGPPPPAVGGLFEVAKLRQVARGAGITEITAQGKYIRMFPVVMTESQTLWLTRVCKGTVVKPATRTVLVPPPRPARAGEPPLRDADLVHWVVQLIEDLVARIPRAAGNP